MLILKFTKTTSLHLFLVYTGIIKCLIKSSNTLNQTKTKLKARFIVLALLVLSTEWSEIFTTVGIVPTS